ncbi:MAG: protein phosphatase 2C domain-containing protein [Microscillaceae bacterium]|nr:protein phosphatase 2C domain-containing protein [Microscillaceae bacterium]MDW8459638.1 protein phosphatase 2C domain-containing protein [Cytophagales bacterium]
MKIYTVIRKGEGHPVFCEDFLVTQYVSHSYYIGAVLDGCSAGLHSHFASSLMGKLISKIARNLPYKDFLENDTQLKSSEIAKEILRKLFLEFPKLIDILGLTIAEILTTITLLVYNEAREEAFIIAMGDGFIAIDGEIIEIDQNNAPEYVAYSLHKDFETWFNNQKYTYEITKPKEVAISSDGISTFRSIKIASRNIDPIEYLLKDNNLSENPQMLVRKCNILGNKYGYKPYDDVSIIRIRF